MPEFQDRDYRFVKTLNHMGKTFTFAAVPHIDAKGNYLYDDIYYNYVDPLVSGADEDGSIPHFFLTFPCTYAIEGMGIVEFDVVDENGNNLNPEGERLTSSYYAQKNAAFQVISDGTRIFLFRPTTDRKLFVDQFIFDLNTRQLNPARASLAIVVNREPNQPDGELLMSNFGVGTNGELSCINGVMGTDSFIQLASNFW